MNIQKIVNNNCVIAVVGLGYVGLPLAVTFAKKYKVIGFDINKEKIEKYKKGIDVTNEVGNEELRNTSIIFSNNEKDLNEADVIIVAVPTPIDKHNKPNLKTIKSSSEIVGRNLKKGSIVVYESTVYPGLTEEICMPILEEKSYMKCGRDFKIAYSPERINPGDKNHRFENIKKVVSGMDKETLEFVAELYENVLTNGVYKASSIKVAEAAKVIENSQRDINIAFVNELAVIFNQMGIDTNEVLDAAGSKWNFLNFRPGLVGGHCIGVDPFYLTYKSEEMGHFSELILTSRKVNDGIGKFIAENVIKELIKSGKVVKNSKVLVLGLTFKENVPDFRNSKVFDVIKELNKYQIKVYAEDPYLNQYEIEKEYNIKLEKKEKNEKVDAIIFAVAHDEYKKMNIKEIKEMLNEEYPLIFDIKQVIDKKQAEENKINLWRL